EAQRRVNPVERGLAVRPVREGHPARRQTEISAQQRSQRAPRHHEAPSVALELEATRAPTLVPGKARAEPVHRVNGQGEIDVPAVNVSGPQGLQAGEIGARRGNYVRAALVAGAGILVTRHVSRIAPSSRELPLGPHRYRSLGR